MKPGRHSPHLVQSPIRAASVCCLLAIVAACSRQADVQPPNTPDQTNATHLLAATDQTFAQEVLEHQNPVVVVMSTQWCPECTQLKPDLENLAIEFDDQVRFREVDAERNRFLAEKYEIKQYPTLLIFVDGKEQDRLAGTAEVANLTQCLTTLLKARASSQTLDDRQ